MYFAVRQKRAESFTAPRLFCKVSPYCSVVATEAAKEDEGDEDDDPDVVVVCKRITQTSHKVFLLRIDKRLPVFVGHLFEMLYYILCGKAHGG